MNGESIIKEDIGILYTYINDIAYGWRSMESKKWLAIPHDQSLTYDFLHESAGLEVPKDHWTVTFDRNFPDKDKLYFENILENGKDILNESNIIIDTIHSIKGGEADHVVLYEKSCWPADLKSKIGLERSSEFRVWYVGATRAKQELHLLRSNHEYTFPLCRMLSELNNVRYENDR
jgi:superfamily I DNA/RNA helicase